MKYKVLTSFLLCFTALLFACKSQKNACIEIKLDNNAVQMVEAASDMTMISYKISEGPLKGYLLEVMGNGDSKEFEVNLIIPDPEKQLMCDKMNPDSWVLEEKKDHKNQKMEFHLLALAKCGENAYCFDLSYKGEMTQMNRMPHEENTEPEVSPSPED